MKVPNFRFNLKFYDTQGNEAVVRTVEELRADFNGSDLYDYYQTGVLQRWLRSLGEQEKADQLDVSKSRNSFVDDIHRLNKALGLALSRERVLEWVKIVELQTMLKERARSRNDADESCFVTYKELESDLLKCGSSDINRLLHALDKIRVNFPSKIGTGNVITLELGDCQWVSTDVYRWDGGYYKYSSTILTVGERSCAFKGEDAHELVTYFKNWLCS